MTVVILSAGIQPGLILRRSWHRIAGTLLALIFLIPSLYLMQLNYRFIPVCFVVAVVISGVAGLNTERYDITVFFKTIAVFFLIAQTIEATTPEGPIEMVINRSVCTLIGAGIILVSDFFLFNAYQYSQKLYLYHQMMLYDFLKKCAKEIRNAQKQGMNSYTFVDRLRKDVIKHFLPIAISSKNIMLDIKVSKEVKQEAKNFQDAVWEIRRMIFALTFSEIMLFSADASRSHWQRYTKLMAKARGNLIKLS